tara:strand:- start:32012 stop:32242 length:231 start_codon:yes stop_codon:yes gene_type:complete
MTNLDKELLKDVLKMSLCTVLTRRQDVKLDCGESVATVDIDSLLELDYALAELLKLSSDDVTFKNIDEAIRKVNEL